MERCQNITYQNEVSKSELYDLKHNLLTKSKDKGESYYKTELNLIDRNWAKQLSYIWN